MSIQRDGVSRHDHDLMDKPSTRPDRALVGVIIAVAVLVIIALIVVFTRGTPASYDENTPEGVVQRYAEAVIAGDEDTARDLLTETLRENCERVYQGPLHDVRLTLTSTNEREERADVQVSVVTTTGGGIFGSSEYASDDYFALVREESGWAIESTPWQFTVCLETAS